MVKYIIHIKKGKFECKDCASLGWHLRKLREAKVILFTIEHKKNMKTIKELRENECIDSYYADGYEDCKKDVLGLIDEIKFSNGCKCKNCKANRSSHVVDAEELNARITG